MQIKQACRTLEHLLRYGNELILQYRNLDGCMDNIYYGQTSGCIIFCCGLIPHLALLTHDQNDCYLNPGFKTYRTSVPLFCFQELCNYYYLSLPLMS